MKVIALDIETKNLDMAADNLSFNEPQGWLVSCVSVWDAGVLSENDYNYAHLAEIPEAVRVAYRVESFETLKHDLEEWYSEGYLLLTKNGAKFDLPIISKPISEGGCGVAEIVQQFEESGQHLDLQVWLEDATHGLRFSLQELVKGVLGESQSKLMEAQFAPSEWNAGNYSEVIEYCAKDSELTFLVWQVARSKGSLQAVAKNVETNQYDSCFVRISW